MSPQPESNNRYRVIYSGRVREALKALIAYSATRGLKKTVIDALQEIDYRLAVYPQFGQPLRNVASISAQIWIGVVPPLTVQLHRR